MIKTYKGLNNTPALPLALDGWTALRKRGFTQNIILLQWDNDAITYSLKSGKVVGVLVYSVLDYRKEIFVSLGYVMPKYRNRGIYKTLWLKLVEIAKASGIVSISGGTYLGNEAMRATNKKLGRPEVAVHTVYDL